jgi:hypothetical protein
MKNKYELDFFYLTAVSQSGSLPRSLRNTKFDIALNGGHQFLFESKTKNNKEKH